LLRLHSYRPLNGVNFFWTNSWVSRRLLPPRFFGNERVLRQYWAGCGPSSGHRQIEKCPGTRCGSAKLRPRPVSAAQRNPSCSGNGLVLLPYSTTVRAIFFLSPPRIVLDPDRAAPIVFGNAKSAGNPGPWPSGTEPPFRQRAATSRGSAAPHGRRRPRLRSQTAYCSKSRIGGGSLAYRDARDCPVKPFAPSLSLRAPSERSSMRPRTRRRADDRPELRQARRTPKYGFEALPAAAPGDQA